MKLSSTVSQNVTTKITKIRKRVIKNIQIIDGKEHVTEEVIEEPVEVEYFEEKPTSQTDVASEPLSSHQYQITAQEGVTTDYSDDVENKIEDEGLIQSDAKSCSTDSQNVTTKITKIRKRVVQNIQIIDGKEHVTEEVIEEPVEVEFFEGSPSSQADDATKYTHQMQITDSKVHTVKKDPKDLISESYITGNLHDIEMGEKSQTYLIKKITNERVHLDTSATPKELFESTKCAVDNIPIIDKKDQVSKDTTEKPVDITNEEYSELANCQRLRDEEIPNICDDVNFTVKTIETHDEKNKIKKDEKNEYESPAKYIEEEHPIIGGIIGKDFKIDSITTSMEITKKLLDSECMHAAMIQGSSKTKYVGDQSLLEDNSKYNENRYDRVEDTDSVDSTQNADSFISSDFAQPELQIDNLAETVKQPLYHKGSKSESLLEKTNEPIDNTLEISKLPTPTSVEPLLYDTTDDKQTSPKEIIDKHLVSASVQKREIEFKQSEIDKPSVCGGQELTESKELGKKDVDFDMTKISLSISPDVDAINISLDKGHTLDQDDTHPLLSNVQEQSIKPLSPCDDIPEQTIYKDETNIAIEPDNQVDASRPNEKYDIDQIKHSDVKNIKIIEETLVKDNSFEQQDNQGIVSTKETAKNLESSQSKPAEIFVIDDLANTSGTSKPQVNVIEITKNLINEEIINNRNCHDKSAKETPQISVANAEATNLKQVAEFIPETESSSDTLEPLQDKMTCVLADVEKDIDGSSVSKVDKISFESTPISSEELETMRSPYKGEASNFDTKPNKLETNSIPDSSKLEPSDSASSDREIIHIEKDLEILLTEENMGHIQDKSTDPKTKVHSITAMHLPKTIDSFSHTTQKLEEDFTSKDAAQEILDKSEINKDTQVLQEKESNTVNQLTKIDINIQSADNKELYEEHSLQTDHTHISPQEKQSEMISVGIDPKEITSPVKIKPDDNIGATDDPNIEGKLISINKLIVKRIQIIDGREQITEEVIEEPWPYYEAKLSKEGPGTPHLLYKQGEKSKNIKLVRRVVIIDGKEHVSEELVEEPDNEFLSETSMTAAVDVQMSKEVIPIQKTDKSEIYIEGQAATKNDNIYKPSVNDPEPEFSEKTDTNVKAPTIIAQKYNLSIEETPDLLYTVEKSKIGVMEEQIPAQSRVEVEPLKIGTIMSETRETTMPEQPQLSYIRQFDPDIKELVEYDSKLEKSLTIDSPLNEINNMFLDCERKNARLGDSSNFDQNTETNESYPHQQTVDISMFLSKSKMNQTISPQVQVDLKLEDFHTEEPVIVKKDVNVNLPSSIICLSQNVEPDNEAKQFLEEDELSNKLKSQENELESTLPLQVDAQSEIEKSILESNSSSLSHYIELSTSPSIVSPKPADNTFDLTLRIQGELQRHETSSGLDEKELGSKNTSVSLTNTPQDTSDTNIYQKQISYGSENIPESASLEYIESVIQSKGEQENVVELKPMFENEIESESNMKTEIKAPNVGKEIIDSSPDAESYQTLSPTSDLTTKVIEECIQASPEVSPKEITTTVTFPIPVVEEVLTNEYAVQTSPDLTEIKQPITDTVLEQIGETGKPASIDIKTQTSVISTSDTLAQTTPKYDKDVDTQTVSEDKEFSDTHVQTSQRATPQGVPDTIEISTQVAGHDIITPQERFSQTSTPICEETDKIKTSDSKEMQTSPSPTVDKDEKYTEISIETTESDVQTVSQKFIDQETSTYPPENKCVMETSMQTHQVPLMNKGTQAEHVEVSSSKHKKEDNFVEMSDLRPVHEMKDVATVDNIQQTSPIIYSEDSISTSTDEPYEIHLRAQIHIPQDSSDFINKEREALRSDGTQLMSSEKSKYKKRKSKKKVETNVPYSPESLSDPITLELSVSLSPSSDSFSIKDISSIDEGVSHLTSPDSVKRFENTNICQPKMSYSDVVQRSKSKSPSPTKNSFVTQKDAKLRLLDALEKRTHLIEPHKTVSEEILSVALLEPSVEKSYNLLINKELSDVEDAVKNNDPVRIEKCFITVIETISIWLEEIQYTINRDTGSGVESPLNKERFKVIQNHIMNLRKITDVTVVNEEIITLIEILAQQVIVVNTLNDQSSNKVKEVENDWYQFLNEIETLCHSVESVKMNMDKIISSDIPTQLKLDKLDEIEADNVTNSDTIKKLFARYRTFIDPKKECPAKLYVCDDDTKQAENSINIERDRLLQLTALAEEYEQTLQDFGQITDIAESLLDGKIIVSNLEHLHEEIQKHRKFFVNLSHCRAILESLENNLDSETRAKFSSLHNSLHDRATAIIDRAASRAQQMTLAASRWNTLIQGMREEQQWLRVAQQRIPDLTNVTSIDHEQYLNLYQSVSLDVSHHHAKLLRLNSITDGLKNLISCSGLESECSLALETLLQLQEDLDSRLSRLITFREKWMTYDHQIDRIEGWIKTANRELQHISPENINTTGNLRRFWELKAQHEVYNNLKNECGLQFEKALEILPISDEMVQRKFFSKIEDEWRDLAKNISHIHCIAIQNISDRDVSSGEKLNILEEEIRELRSALDGLKGVIKSEDELNLYIERLQVMTGRIDRIQNELGRLSLLPTAESERLGALLVQSRLLDDQISEELERSIMLKEKILQVQQGISRCQKSQRRARLTLEECEAAERLGSDVVEKASETCDILIEELGSQWRDILALRQALHTLPISLRVCVSPTNIEKDISALQEIHVDLEKAFNDLSARLRAKMQLWRRFERQLELVQGAVREADYMVELLTVQGQVDYDRLLKATEKLENLSDSLSRRSGELVGQLRDAAAPLEASIEPNIAAKLKRELDDAAEAYEHTRKNLTQLCDKYHKAVDLWKRYRDAAAAVRAFAEFQEGRVHALRPDDAPAAAQACLEQEARVSELRSLAARVAAETGSRALQADADALARRLQLVAGAVQALADLGEARQLARQKAQHAKEKLCDMRQDLTPVQEDSEIVEDKLIALRENLIALGKTEADIIPAKAELPDIDRDVSEEHSIVRILELWQAMFRDTFLHYHRLSTALVRSGDATTALRLWNEYLLDLQSFLSGAVPADYENLTEHRRLCRVHRNLLTSQRSVLMNENKELKNKELADKFDTLTNLHNETLARIVERNDEVSTRIAAWDDYRDIYTELLRWLKDIEVEKEKLQLRYVHIKRIHKILTKIQNLSNQVPEGRNQTDKLLSNLKKVLEFTDETYGASVRMEYTGIVKRVDNLQASLNTWRDFLTRILELISEYESTSNNLHKLYSKAQDEVMSYSDEEPLSRPQLKKVIEKYTDLRTDIDKTNTKIEEISVIQEQLKECLSPQDIRIVNQRVWQLRQQRADLEHQLTIIIHRLQERLELYCIFEARLTRFVEWLTTLERRIETSSESSETSILDPQDLIRRLNSDIQTETSLKEREFEWINQIGNVLVEISKKDEKSFSNNMSKQIKDVEERWHRLQETGRNRIAKINELLETISQLEERLTEIRLKLHSIESSLSSAVVIDYLTAKFIDEKFKERDDLQKDIESESGEVGETLNLCELVFSDPNILKANFDIRNLRTGVDIIEKKWKNICEMSEERKKILKEIRKSAELTNSLLPKIEKKLDSIEKRVEKIETRKQRGDGEDESVSKSVIKDLDAMESSVKQLEDAYSRIVSARGIELRGQGADSLARLRSAVRTWQQLRGRVDAAGEDVYRQFVAAHSRAVMALAETDVRLTRALHLSPTPLDKVAALKELEGVEHDLYECEALVETADRLASAAGTVTTSTGGVASAANLAAEYRALYADVTARLQAARADVIGDVDSAVQVDTLKWEADASLQVDTLTSKETYHAELVTAVKESSEVLEALRTILQQQPKENASGEELATAGKEIAKAGAKPAQLLELAKHLSELLLTECDATEEEAMLKEVETLAMRYEDLLAQAKKRELQINNLRLPHSASYALTCEHETGRLTCPLCSERNWKQLDNDLWRLEQWLQFAEATDAARTDPPEQYDTLEDAIQDHREFLLDLDSHKSLVVSLNVVGGHVAAHASSAQEASRVRARLSAANARWDTACERAHHWQRRLQRALVHNQQFHDIVVELVSRLGKAERGVRSREPLRLNRPPAELQRDFRRLSELRDELARAEPRVLALHDAAQLLRSGDAPAVGDDICRRLGELRLRLQSLRKLSGVYALKLGAALARASPAPASVPALAAAVAATTSAAPQLLEEDEEQVSGMELPPLDENDIVISEETEEQEMTRLQRGLRFVCRVARASLPFQALLLLLLGAAALAPNAHSDCRSTGLAFEPVLRYPEGPPPL